LGGAGYASVWPCFAQHAFAVSLAKTDTSAPPTTSARAMAAVAAPSDPWADYNARACAPALFSSR
jgi:hypothetical protein